MCGRHARCGVPTWPMRSTAKAAVEPVPRPTTMPLFTYSTAFQAACRGQGVAAAGRVHQGKRAAAAAVHRSQERVGWAWDGGRRVGKTDGRGQHETVRRQRCRYTPAGRRHSSCEAGEPSPQGQALSASTSRLLPPISARHRPGSAAAAPAGPLRRPPASSAHLGTAAP